MYSLKNRYSKNVINLEKCLYFYSDTQTKIFMKGGKIKIKDRKLRREMLYSCKD